MNIQVISDELAARLDNMTPETRAMRFGKVLQNMQNAVNEQAAIGPMVYQGTWNASTNTPTLADGTGDNGSTYRVSVAGSQDLGAGSISFSVDDRVIYNGTTWEKWDANDAVQSVFSRTGAVTAQAGDYSAYYAAKTKFARIADLKSAGTNGGTSAANAKQVRDMNTVISDADSIIKGINGTNGTAAKQFKLSAGTYDYLLRVPGNLCGKHRAYLEDVTNSMTLAKSGSCYSTSNAATYNVQTDAIIKDRFTITEDTIFQIKQYTEHSVSDNGLGIATNHNSEDEIFSEMSITQVA